MNSLNRQQKTHNTIYSGKIRELIEACGYTYVEEFPITQTSYTVDFYLPDQHLAIEADGPHHVMQQEKDKKRDGIIFSKTGLLVLRIPFKQYFSVPRQEMLKIICEFADRAEKSAFQRRYNLETFEETDL